jgi:thymidine phosphorylase
MVELGKAHGVTTVALLTDMSTPLGLTIGNGLEVQESLEVLAGGGPADIVELTLALAREMLAVAGIDADPAQALRDGRAMDTWRAMIRAQGGDPDSPLATAAHQEVVRAQKPGYVSGVDAMGVGLAAWRLGAGRARKEDPVSAAAGVVLKVKPGDQVRAGDVLCELHADDESRIPAAKADAEAAFTLSDTASTGATLVIDRVA